MKFKDKLVSIRKEKGLTQKQLAEKTGISLRVIQSYENGSRFPRDKYLAQIADVLDVNYFALKDIDYSSDSESLRQLFIQLEDDGLFDISDVEQVLEYKDYAPVHYLKLPVSRDVAGLVSSWKEHSTLSPEEELIKPRPVGMMPGTSYVDYKYNLWKTSEYKGTTISDTRFEDGFSTSELLAYDAIDRKTAIKRLQNKQYSKTDFVQLLCLLNKDSRFVKDCGEYEALKSILSDSDIPDDLITAAFGGKNPPISGGPVLDIYNEISQEIG